MKVGRTIAVSGLAAVLLAGGLALPAGASEQAQRAYANCTALNRDYPHGVMKRSYSRAYWKRNGATGRPAVRPRIYAANYRSLDRDGDGIACEK